MMAGASTFTIKVRGKGSHAASPHQGIDPVVCAAQMVTGVPDHPQPQRRSVGDGRPLGDEVKAGDAFNVIPQFAELRGTVRTFKTEVRDQVFERMREIAENLGKAMRCTVEFESQRPDYPGDQRPGSD